MRRGFTLIELLVAMTLAGFIFVISSTVLFTIFRSDTRSRKLEKVEQVKNDLFVELSNEIRWAKGVSIDSGASTLKITDAEDKETVYAFSGSSLTKNGQKITPNSVAITKFDLEEYLTVPANVTGHSPYPGVKVEVEFLDQVTGLTADTLKLFVAMRKTDTN